MASDEKRQVVLIVDDIKTNILVVREILSDLCDTIYATSGKEALELTWNERPDLVLLDVMMPEMDGFEVLKALKESDRSRHIPVMFITAMDDEIDEEKGLDLGAIDYITKPVSPPIVRARVRNHLELKSIRDRLEAQAMVDGLTGLSNRRRFDEYLDSEWKRGIRNGSSIALCLIDVDFFKRYNDHYGHPAGDECLRRVGEAIRDVLARPSDMAARYGGEEFAVVLPETDESGALEVAERARRAIEALSVPHAESEISEVVSVSVGVCVMHPTIFEKTETLAACADAKLYEAKKEGRNRVVV